MPEVRPIYECAFRKCKRAATSKVTHYGQYPHQVCEKHIPWAKQRVLEIENS